MSRVISADPASVAGAPQEYQDLWLELYGGVETTSPEDPPQFFYRNVEAVTANTVAGTAQEIDYSYVATGSLTITLPVAGSRRNAYVVRNAGAGIVQVGSASTIEGDASISIYPGESMEFRAFAEVWRVV